MDDHKKGCSGEPRPGHLLLTSTDSLCFLATRSALHIFAPYQVQPPKLETSGAKNMFEVVDVLLITGRQTLQRAKPTGADIRPQNMLRLATLNTDN